MNIGKKIESICYLAVITRLDIIKAVFKLLEFLTNLGPDHLVAADQCLRYLYATKYLKIKYSASANEDYLVVKISDQSDQIFEAMSDVLFANFSDRKSGKGYAFRLYKNLID